MFAGEPIIIECGDGLDDALEALPTGMGVYVIRLREGEPYLGKTGVLRRRLKRLLRAGAASSRLLNLRSVAERIEYWPTASRLETALVLYEQARKHKPGEYIKFLKLRMPPYIKLMLANPFPRTQVTSRLAAGAGLYYGPFRTRAAAEEFEHQLLDLFQLRRCLEDLAPAPDHPGCMYGEMNMCLRPCQLVVGEAEYASEASRVADFLRSQGRAILHTSEAARDRLSAEMEFEAAAREHKRIERIAGMIKSRDALARDVDSLAGIAITPSIDRGVVKLWLVLRGALQSPVEFGTAEVSQSVSMDRRLKETLAAVTPVDSQIRDRQEHLAMIARWYYSSWRDGEWIEIESLYHVPYRRLVHAISRVVHESAPTASH
jgi:excinuclease UvrABC nuclease subunit